MPLRHFKETQNAGAIGAPLGGNRANPGKHPRGNSGAISGAIGAPPGGNWDPPNGFPPLLPLKSLYLSLKLIVL